MLLQLQLQLLVWAWLLSLGSVPKEDRPAGNPLLCVMKDRRSLINRLPFFGLFVLQGWPLLAARSPGALPVALLSKEQAGDQCMQRCLVLI